LWEFGEATNNEVVVVESQPSDTIGVKYKGAISIHPNEQFNHNRFRNLGYNYLKSRNRVKADYVLMASNELLFNRYWFNSLIIALNNGYDSVSPICTRWAPHRKFSNTVNEGWRIGIEFTDWCLLFKSESLNKLMPLNELHEGSTAVESMVEEMKKLNMKHALITNSCVTRNDLFRL
jgi:hypothetical protein